VALYEYQCRPNSHRFEVRHGMNENPIQACPECGGEVRRVIQPVGVVFKGSGFYATDSRKPAPTSKPAETKESKAKESGSAEAKSDGSGAKESASPASSSTDGAVTKPAAG
jgi:putative FmdB family regulatory protein